MFDEHVNEWSCGCQIAIGNGLPLAPSLWAAYYIWQTANTNYRNLHPYGGYEDELFGETP